MKTKNKLKKIIAWIVGGVFLTVMLLGICVLFFPRGAAIGVGIAIICVSLAFGMILINPLFIIPLALGVLMLFVPPYVSGIILIVLGAVFMVANPIVYKKIKR